MLSKPKLLVLAKTSELKLSWATMLGALPRMVPFQSATLCPLIDGEPIAEEIVLGTEAPESEVEESTGGC
jgi:hypothetical protein